MISKKGKAANAPALLEIALARRTQIDSRMLAVLQPRIEDGVPSAKTIRALAALLLLITMTVPARPAVASVHVQKVAVPRDTTRRLVGAFGGDTLRPRQTGFAEAVEDCPIRGKGRVAFCETRRIVFDQKKSKVTFDGGYLDGIIITTSSSRRTTSVRALVRAQGTTMDGAHALAKNIKLTVGKTIRSEASGVSDKNSWQVLYEVTVPEGTSVKARTTNGRIALSYFRGRADIVTSNGPLLLNEVAGDITGGTKNGPMYVELSGDHWDGKGLSLHSSNGAVDLIIPDDYSAHLVAGTLHGPLDMQRPLNIRRLTSKRITADLGKGGKTVRVTTENGPATIH